MEAQFLGIKDGKVNLHKANGVKIAVPLAKMSVEDLEYIKQITGLPLSTPQTGTHNALPKPQLKQSSIGASIEQPYKPDYDWFQFFLFCEVAVGLCERYAQAFVRASMDQSVLPDVDATVLRALGLREGDIIKVMRALDIKFGRCGNRVAAGSGDASSSNDAGVGLFSGPGGALRNNTKKTRPSPAVPASTVVDPNVFAAGWTESDRRNLTSSVATPGERHQEARSSDSLHDDTWELKPSKQQTLSQSPTGHVQSPQLHPKEHGTATSMPTSITSETIPATQEQSAAMQGLSVPHESWHPNKLEEITLHTSKSAMASLDTTMEYDANSSRFNGINRNASTVDQMKPLSIAASMASTGQQRPLAPHSTGISNPPLPFGLLQRAVSAPIVAQASVFTPPPPAPIMTGLQVPVASPGQSLDEIGNSRFQTPLQQSQFMAQATGMNVPFSGLQMGIMPQHTQLPHAHFPQPLQTGVALNFPTQHHMLQHQYPQAEMNRPINLYLPPALEPERIGATTLQTRLPGMAAIVPPSQPLQPPKMGPPPDIRFGVKAETRTLTPQPTGRKAKLSQASTFNPPLLSLGRVLLRC